MYRARRGRHLRGNGAQAVISREGQVVEVTSQPLTVETLAAGLRSGGLAEGQTVLVHGSLSSLGWVVGGAVAVIEALLLVLGPRGTLVMPSHTPENTEPSAWKHPPVPKEWWQLIRDSMPPFEPKKSPTRGMGKIAESFRSWPGVSRSDHPVTSFAALGPNAGLITRDHDLEGGLGEHSPLGRLYELDAHVLLLGVNHDSNTSLHLAEARSWNARRRYEETGSAVIRDGMRQWVRYRQLDGNDEDFPALGLDFEAQGSVGVWDLGMARVRFMRQRELVDFGVSWLEENRKG